MRAPTGVISTMLALAGADLLDDRADALSGHVHDQTLDGLALLAVDGLVQHARGRDLELIALAAHGLDEDGQATFRRGPRR